MGSGLWGLIAAPLFYYEEGEWCSVVTGAATADLARYRLHRLPGLAGDAGLEHGGGRGLHGLAHCLRHPYLRLPQGASARVCRAATPSVQAIRQFRVDPAHEIRGLDVVKHSEPAYPIGERRQPGLQYQPCAGAYIEDDLKKPPEVTTPRLEQKQQLDMRMPQVQGF